MGIDGITTTMLKRFKDVLIGPLTDIINKAIYTATYLWKEGIITPLPKKVDLTLLKNWRPVTILNSSSKILEKILHEQLTQFLEENNLFPKQQFAYRANKSTTATLLEIETSTRVAMDKGKVVSILLVDLSAAFDCIDC